MNDLKYILPPILFVVAFAALVIFLYCYTPTHTIRRYDNNVICTVDKDWGFKKENKICYGIYKLEVEPNIHYEPIK